MSADYKVHIVSPLGTVYFEASTPISESRTASYDRYNIIHLPTDLLAYRNTSGRKFNISAKFISRNEQEAITNAKYLNMIRSWMQPDFGGSGATPPILFLSAYNNSNIKNTQCVLTNYSWQYPDDVDYIFTADEKMPVIGLISIELDEIYSAKQITAKKWKMVGPGTDEGFTSDLLTSTPDVSLLSSEFSGLLASAGLLDSTSLSSIMKTADAATSIVQNPTFGNIANVANSPQLSEVTSGISEITNNTMITGGLVPGESSGVPSSSSVTSAVKSASDAFGRVSRAITSPIFG